MKQKWYTAPGLRAKQRERNGRLATWEKMSARAKSCFNGRPIQRKRMMQNPKVSAVTRRGAKCDPISSMTSRERHYPTGQTTPPEEGETPTNHHGLHACDHPSTALQPPVSRASEKSMRRATDIPQTSKTRYKNDNARYMPLVYDKPYREQQIRHCR